MTQELATKQFNFEITSMKQAMEYAKMIADSDLAPKDYRGKPGNVLIAMQFGSEIGLKPMQAVQNIAVINGRPSIWGDAMIALVQNSPLCEYIKEWFDEDTAYCEVKRKGDSQPYIYEFSKEDAKVAGLANKSGPWTQYPHRMMQMRARGFALRDKFSDVLKGISIIEEVRDYQIIEHDPVKNKENAAEKVSSLIENKSAPQKTITLDSVIERIDGACNLPDLKLAIQDGVFLNQDDQDTLKALYNCKKAALLKQNETIDVKTGEIKEHEQTETNHDSDGG